LEQTALAILDLSAELVEKHLSRSLLNASGLRPTAYPVENGHLS
jgi:hypothetical protein